MHIEENSHLNDVNCVRFSNDGSLLASASDDGSCSIWKIIKQDE